MGRADGRENREAHGSFFSLCRVFTPAVPEPDVHELSNVQIGSVPDSGNARAVAAGAACETAAAPRR